MSRALLPLSSDGSFRTTPFARSTSFLWNDPAYSDLGHHIRVMESAGVEAEVLVPSSLLLESFRAAGVASEEGMPMVNDAYGEAVRVYPGRFIGTAAVDPFAGKAALKEIERGVTGLGLKAVSMMASYDGLYIDDEQFWPIYRLAQELHVPVMAHPVSLTPFWKETQRAKTTMLRGEISMLLDSTIKGQAAPSRAWSLHPKYPPLCPRSAHNAAPRIGQCHNYPPA